MSLPEAADRSHVGCCGIPHGEGRRSSPPPGQGSVPQIPVCKPAGSPWRADAARSSWNSSIPAVRSTDAPSPLAGFRQPHLAGP